MFKRLINGGKHTATILLALCSPAQYTLLKRMVAFSRQLPHQFEQPLPNMMAQLTPPAKAHSPLDPNIIRYLADAVAAWHFWSPLGICLRRSLLRYHFLQEANVPVQIIFGARLKSNKEGGGLGGHAWLSLNNQPYYENPKDFEGFVQMYVYPSGE